MKNIIFDLGGVILKDKPISVLNNIDIDNDVYNELKLFFDNWDDLDLGEKSLLEKYNEFNFSTDLYKDRLVNYFLYRDFNMDLISLLGVLKSKNYNLYVLSDNNFDAYDFYKSNDLFKDIDGWVMSCDYHTLKKDGVLFDILIDKFSLNPSECYFIDDRKVNIDEAFKRNIKGFVFNNDIELLYEDMRSNGIDI